MPFLLESLAQLFTVQTWAAAAKTADALHAAAAGAVHETTNPFALEEEQVPPPPALDILLGKTEAASTSNTASLLASVYRELDWYRSGRAQSGFYAQIVGPGSRYHHAHARVGLFMLPANYLYPDHQHAADEIYVVVAGNADWSLDRQPFVTMNPGDTIEIPSMTVHAMRTRTGPALMLWSWTGDISLGTYRFTD